MESLWSVTRSGNCVMLIAILLAAPGCERAGDGAESLKSSRTPAEAGQPPMATGTHSVPVESEESFRQAEALARVNYTKELVEIFKKTDYSYEELSEAIARFLDQLPSDVDGNFVALLAIRQVPPEALEAQWKLVNDYASNPLELNSILSLVLRIAVEADPSWAVGKIREIEDLELCDSGIQAFLRHYRSTAGNMVALTELRKSFGDTDLFSMGVSYWLTDVKNAETPRFVVELEALLADDRLDRSVKGEAAVKLLEAGSDRSPVERARLLVDNGVSGGLWSALIAEGVKLQGAESERFIEEISRASRYEAERFAHAYVGTRKPSEILTSMPRWTPALQDSLMYALASQIFTEGIVDEASVALDAFPIDRQVKLVEILVICAAQQGRPLEELAPVLDIAGNLQKNAELFSRIQKGNDD